MNKALGLLEFSSTAKGAEATDAMTKAAAVKLDENASGQGEKRKAVQNVYKSNSLVIHFLFSNLYLSVRRHINRE
ncbi:BMC domain-containing protein [Parendozoicomonas sp. Alg238-R29]|uniref:BMC domain-containing protein n=1 Tax=Parendozoicomonas sp. Alg238-R29 TaxID=2993446 RepID=UPI00248D6028|nr:BMC domain-containing protein [Parendozoicomonas sp. Alg238-R29]